MLIEHTNEINDLPAPEVEEIEHIELSSLPVDPRLSSLSEGTRAVIGHWFSSDVDEALYTAERLLNLYRHPPTWAIELVGPRRGWKSFDKSRV